MTTKPKAPAGLAAGGGALWKAITTEHPDLDPAQLVQLVEACRAKDRLDRLDRVLSGEDYLRVEDDGSGHYVLRVDGALMGANATANLMKQLLAAMRLPDEATGRRPQRRGARGAQRPSVPGGRGGTVSSIERARQRSSGA